MLASTERFDVKRVIGEGSHGVVYEIVERETGIRRALKTLRTLSPEAFFSFKQEFRSIQNINHPNLVELFELANAQGTWFFTMQLVEGVSFLEYVRPANLGLAATQVTNRIEYVPVVPTEREVDSGELGHEVIHPVTVIGGNLDIDRLQKCLVQLTHGLMALHEAGKVHRDIKPNNTLVNDEGRLFILDFGLAQDIQQAPRERENEIIGTVAYMAPEQAAARTVGPAADWYAVGVMLFEALTGRLPFAGKPMRILLDKQSIPAPDPRKFSPEIPDSLAQLALDLLEINPSARPTGHDILASLQAAPATRAIWSSSTPSGFIGRITELDVLTHAYADATNRARAVCIAGKSGMGKTTLMRRFVRNLEQRSTVPLIVEGACYQRESVPFKGIDGALDALASALSSIDQMWVKSCLPTHAGLLTQFFPVLSRVSAFAEAARVQVSGLATDPTALRQELFATLRAFLRNLAEARPLVFILDDMQWAGEDTWALLREVFRNEEAPKLLLVTIVRLEEDGTEERLRLRHSELQGLDQTWLELTPLSIDESQAMARQLLKRVGAPIERAAQVVKEAAGHPLLLDALARAGAEQGERTLDEMLLQRVRSIHAPAQRVLEFCSLSNTPIVQQAVARAVDLDFGKFSEMVGALKVVRLVQTSGGRQLDTIQPFHDRVRVAVAKSLSHERKQQMHAQLAVALESAMAPDSEALAWHWAQAGDDGRAAQHAIRAGAQAMERLAFERAAHFYQQAVAFTPNDTTLLTKLGEALIGAGRGTEAGEAFERAAAAATALEGLDFTRRAAHEFLRSGQTERGLARLGEVLRASGAPPVPSRIRALVSLLFDRLVLALRGIKFQPRSSLELAASTLLRIDATWAAAEVLTTLDMVKGASMQIRNLRLALAGGEPLRIARALAMQATVVATSGASGRTKAREMHAEAMMLALKIGDRQTLALVKAVDGIIDFLTGNIEMAHPRLVDAMKSMQLESRGTRFELTNTQLFLLVDEFYTGQLQPFLKRVPEFLEEGQRRGDLFALTSFRVNHCNVYWLARDESDEALKHIDNAVAQWAVHGYQTLHYYALLARVQVALYCGDGDRAYRLVSEDWPRMTTSFLLTAQMLRIEALHLRGRAACAAGKTGEVHRMQRALEKERHPVADAFALLLAIGLNEPADWRRERWREIETRLEKSHLHTFLWAVRYRRDNGGLASEWFQEQGVRNPERFVRMLVPLTPAGTRE